MTDQFGHVLTYDGSRWTSHKLKGVDALASISCSSSTFCAAADLSGHVTTYNGTKWSAPRQLTDKPGIERASVSLSCRSSTFCVLTSDHEVSIYDGKTWSSPTVLDKNGYLMSLSCPTKDFCEAIDNLGRVVTAKR